MPHLGCMLLTYIQSDLPIAASWHAIAHGRFAWVTGNARIEEVNKYLVPGHGLVTIYFTP